MKKAKIISAISLLILCVCILTVGVISADSIPEVGMSGSIKVPANEYIVGVKGFIGESLDLTNLPAPDFCSEGEPPENNPNGTVYGDTWVFTQAQLSKMTFDLNGVNTLEDFQQKAVYITFLIETTSTFDMRAYFTKQASKDSWVEASSDTLGSEAIAVTLNKADIAASGTDGTGVTQTFISIKFSPLKFAESAEGEQYNFSYVLNVDANLEQPSEDSIE